MNEIQQTKKNGHNNSIQNTICNIAARASNIEQATLKKTLLQVLLGSASCPTQGKKNGHCRDRKIKSLILKKQIEN